LELRRPWWLAWPWNWLKRIDEEYRRMIVEIEKRRAGA
jgi:hypothetical protein